MRLIVALLRICDGEKERLRPWFSLKVLGSRHHPTPLPEQTGKSSLFRRKILRKYWVYLMDLDFETSF